MAALQRAHRIIFSAAFFVAICLFVFSVLRAEEKAPAASAAQNEESGKDELAIAVLGFANKGPSVELAPLGIALAEMLTGDLARFEGVRAVERVRVSQFLGETDLTESALVGKATAERTGQALAASYMVSGTFSATPERIAVKAELYRVGKDGPIEQWSLETPPDGFFDLEHQLCTKVLQALGFKSPIRRPPPTARQGPSPTLAVLALQNLGPSARLQAMENGFAELLQALLSAMPDVRLVEREKLFAVLAEQQLSVSGLADPATAAQVGRLLGAERFLYGSFMELGDELRIDLRLADTKTASVLRAESATGPTERFAELLEELAVRVTADLAIHPPTNAETLVRAASPARNIEAAIHYTNAQLSFYRARYAEAASNYERVLLIEPKNVHAGLGRLKSWLLQKEYDKAREAGEQTLSLPFLPEQSALKEETFFRLVSARWGARQYTDAIQVCDRLLQEFPGTRYRSSVRLTRALGLMYAGRRDQGVTALEAAVKDQRARADAQNYSFALRSLHSYYMSEPRYIQGSREYQQRRGDADYMRGIARRTKEVAARTIELYELILQDLEGKRDVNSRMWAQSWAIHGTNPSWISEQGSQRPLLPEEQRERLIVRAIETFSWEPKITYKAHVELSELSEKLDHWQQSLESYQYLLEHPEHDISEFLPVSEDLTHHTPSSAVARQIEAQFKIATIYRDHRRQPDIAIREFKQLVHDFGVTHHRGVNTVAALHELGASFEFPDKAALVWGGGAETLAAWRAVLKPLGYTAHHVGQYRISAVHLAPYQIVILVRTGLLPYEPTDILALRSYVATGGSLLVVVSPGWEPATPGIHNPLLAFFDAHAGQDMVVRANSTRIASHAITADVKQVMAKNAVHLTTSSDAALIEADDRTVLAAIGYRHGRVVIASFGQWFHPEPGRPAWKLTRRGGHWTRQIPPDERPIEAGRGLHIPLLRNVMAWLNEPHDRGDLARLRQPFVDAHRAGLLDQFRMKPRADLAGAMEDLIGSVPDGMWKEESLWVAGESSLQLFYFPKSQNHPAYGWPVGGPPAAEPRYFQQLVGQFPDSPLRPFAQWRLADTKRRQLLRAEQTISDDPATHRQAAIEAFLKVEAPKGSYAWAWTQLRIGSLLFRNRDFGSALPHYRDVVERMANGPEKSLALMNMSVCHQALGSVEEARRYDKLVLSLPDIYWWTTSSCANWAPMWESGSAITDTSHDWAKKRLRE